MSELCKKSILRAAELCSAEVSPLKCYGEGALRKGCLSK